MNKALQKILLIIGILIVSIITMAMVLALFVYLNQSVLLDDCSIQRIECKQWARQTNEVDFDFCNQEYKVCKYVERGYD